MIQVTHTSSHSSGQYCFYEPEKKLLYSGDLIYKETLDTSYPTTDPLIFLVSKAFYEFQYQQNFPRLPWVTSPVSPIGEIKSYSSRIEKKGQLKKEMDCLISVTLEPISERQLLVLLWDSHETNNEYKECCNDKNR